MVGLNAAGKNVKAAACWAAVGAAPAATPNAVKAPSNEALILGIAPAVAALIPAIIPL
ncbi:hypothetical protein D9M72_583010 [compost metagenome]